MISYSKTVLKIEEVATILGISKEEVTDLITNGDIDAVGSQKNLVKYYELMKFMGLDETEYKNSQNSLDISENQRSNPHTYSCEVNDLTEEEWDKMKTTVKKEHTPYFNRQKGKWCIALSLGKNEEGKRIRKIITGKTEEEVWAAYKEYIRQQDEVAPIADDTKCAKDGFAQQMGLQTYHHLQEVTFREHYKKFLASLESSISNDTYTSYIELSTHILEAMGDLKMYELNQQILVNFFRDMVTKQYSAGKSTIPNTYYSQSTLSKLYDLLKRFITGCSDQTSLLYIGMTNYMLSVRKPKSNALPKEEIKAFTDEEIATIFSAVKEDALIYCWIRILAETGARPSEALALQWKDIDFEEGSISINKALSKTRTHNIEEETRTTPYAIIKTLKNDGASRNHCRKIPISKGLVDLLKQWQQHTNYNKKMREGRVEHQTTQQVFTSPSGGLWKYKDYNQKYKRLLKKAGLSLEGFNPYRFRHTFCTYLVENDVHVKYIQMLMGDSTLETVMNTYANVEKEKAYQQGFITSKRIQNIAEAQA